jgi:hypothetical protein
MSSTAIWPTIVPSNNLTQVVTAGADPTVANSLRISEDGRMAIEDTNGARQAKVFFAERDVVKKSNAVLTKRGSRTHITSLETRSTTSKCTARPASRRKPGMVPGAEVRQHP